MSVWKSEWYKALYRIENIDLEKTIISLFLLAFVLLVLSMSIGSAPDWHTTVYGIGISLLCSAVVLLFSFFSTTRAQKTAYLMEEWGSYAVYDTRQKMNRSCDQQLDYASDRVDVIAWGLKSFRHAKSDLIKERVKNGLKIRILAPHPFSMIVAKRDLEEERKEGSTKADIETLRTWVKRIANEEGNKGSIELRFFDALPQDFYFRVDDTVFIGPYLYGLESQQTISFEYRGGKILEYYNKYFNKLWDNPAFCKDATAD